MVTVWQSENGKTMEGIKSSVVVKGHSGGMDEQVEQWNSSIWANNGGCWICVIIHLSISMWGPTPRVNSNVSSGLWLWVMCQCNCIDWTNVSLCGLLRMRKPVREWDRAYMGYLSVSAAQLYCESKTPLKNKSYDNKDVKREDWIVC